MKPFCQECGADAEYVANGSINLCEEHAIEAHHILGWEVEELEGFAEA